MKKMKIDLTGLRSDKNLYEFRDAEALRLASLGGIEQDLQGVINYCRLLTAINSREPGKFGLFEHEAVSSAAIIRYARCFGHGKRDWLRNDYLSGAEPAMKEFHEYILAVRDRHVAHSVNPFEENAVTMEIGVGFTSSTEIHQVHTAQHTIGFFLLEDPKRLQQLAEWVLTKVREEKAHEQARLLPLIHQRPLVRLRKHSLFAERAAHNPNAVRKRP